MSKFLRLYLQPRLLVILVLGIISGLPLALTMSTLGAWLTESGVSLSAIGLFALVGVPYSLKFLWSPVVDGLRLPILTKLLGKRRAWIFFAQIFLMASLAALGLSNPSENAWFVAFFAVLVAFSSATQDIVIDAYRIEILSTEEQGAGAAMAVLGWRLGTLLSGGGALFLATAYGWTATYIIMAGCVPIAWIAMWVGGEPAMVDGGQWSVDGKKEKHQTLSTIHRSLIEPFTDFNFAIYPTISLGRCLYGGDDQPVFNPTRVFQSPNRNCSKTLRRNRDYSWQPDWRGVSCQNRSAKNPVYLWICSRHHQFNVHSPCQNWRRYWVFSNFYITRKYQRRHGNGGFRGVYQWVSQ